jgi:serine/threonine protein kinase/tetratricopeptide (TPR) repeat protein
MPDHVGALSTGARIGPYEVLGPLGQGGMGEVYRARDVRLERDVAIKALPSEFALDPARLARFEREAKLLASLNHPNIAGIHGIEDSQGIPYLVLEFVDGQTLAQRLAGGPLPVRDVLEVGAQIASAIEAAHERGVVHRDLKPGNVMVTAAGAVKVLDFGIAKDAGAPSDSSVTTPAGMTAAGAVLGTAAYMSPEQARGAAVDRRTDIWSFGCVLFECLGGRRPFAGETASDMIARVLERDPEWSALPASTPVKLRDLIRRCLRKQVEDRPRAIGELRQELKAIAADLPRTSGAAQTTPSVAVLYFENISSDKESDYFCAGITEDILTDLSKIKGMRVASRNAVARYRGAVADIPRVATELGVTTVMEGSVRRSGDRVRITAQLINASDGFHLWAERYDRTLQDVFAVQEEIASSIAAALRVALTPAEERDLQRDRPASVQAYDLYLKGRESYSGYTSESLHRALDLFQQAIALDAGYALAWAGTADCYGQFLQHGGSSMSREELARLGLEAARKAIGLDPRLPEAHKAEALVLRFTGNPRAARAALLRAIEVNPRFTPALINLAVDEYCQANLAATERLTRSALLADPQEFFAKTWLANLTHQTGRWEESLRLSQEIRSQATLTFYRTGTYMLTAAVHLRRNDLEAARREYDLAKAGGAEPANVQVLEAMLADRSGRGEDAMRLLAAAETSQDLGMQSVVMGAGLAARHGDIARALRFMARPFLTDMFVVARVEPDLRPLLDYPPLAPRRSTQTLVWPAEAPPPPEELRALFQDVRIESGLPEATR